MIGATAWRSSWLLCAPNNDASTLLFLTQHAMFVRCAPKQASVACIDVYRVTNAGDAYAYYHAWFRFRLLGSELVARAGYEMTGKMVDDLPSSQNRSVLLRRCHDLVRTRQPSAQCCERIIDGETTRYEAV